MKFDLAKVSTFVEFFHKKLQELSFPEGSCVSTSWTRVYIHGSCFGKLLVFNENTHGSAGKVAARNNLGLKPQILQFSAKSTKISRM